MAGLNWRAIEAAELVSEPFEHFVVTQALEPGCVAAVPDEYPAIRASGSFSLADAPPGPVLSSLISDLQSDRFREEMERIFSLDLRGKPASVTLRGQSSPRDGRIHTDSRSKILSLLLYMNADWRGPEGQLRLLRNGGDLDAVAVEVPATLGSLVVFRRCDHSWHGHTAYSGQRRVLQFNYLQSERASVIDDLRHRLSAFTKQLVA